MRFTHDRLDATSMAGARVLALKRDRQGHLWIGTDGQGLDIYDGTTFQHYSPGSGLTGARIVSLLEDNEGHVWVGVGGGGLTRVVDRGGTRLSFIAYRHDPANPTSIASDDIRTMAVDRSGTIWMGTDGLGLSYVRPTGRIQLTRYRHAPSDERAIGDDRVHALHVDRSGTTWIGTWAGLTLLRPGADRFERLPSAGVLNDNRVTALAEAPDGSIWVGTLDGGVNRVDQRGRALASYRARAALQGGGGLSSDRVTALAAEGGRIWIGTLTAGLNALNPETGEIVRYRRDATGDVSLSSDRIQRLRVDARGRVWIGTADGLDVLDPATGVVRRVASASGAPAALGGTINAILEYPAGLMWVGTATGGLVRFQVAENGGFSDFRVFGRGDGLPSATVLRVVHDGAGYLWVATSEALTRFDPRSNTVLSFDETDGLPSGEFHSSAYAPDADRILLGGARGLVMVDPASARPNPYAPPVALTGFTILNRPVPIGGDSPLSAHINHTREVRLPPEAAVFTFEFSAFNYGASDRVRYAYRLVGFDHDWNYVDASRRAATYTNLNPGRYTFEVRAANRDGVWSEHPVRLDVVVLPPYWRTWWFQALLVLSALGLVVGLHRYRVSAIQEQRRRLERVVEARTSELRDQTEKATEARAAAERANADKSRFLANITHEIRTPLNAVVGLSDALGGTRLNPQQQEYARALRSAGEALSEIVADILDVSKIEADRFELARAAFELRRLIDEAADVVRVSALNKALRFEVSVAADVPAVVLGDHRALRRVLLNLLGNAVKFTDAGAVTLDAARGQGESDIVFIVTDTGIGIPLAEQKRIFESFVQADATIASKYGGTGLGLAISRRLVELMGGRLWLESVPGRGSTFSFSAPLPMVAPAVSASDVAPPRDDRPLRILVVDDAEQNRMVMRAYFQDTPHSITMARSGPEALELFAASRYDVVLMDVQMPGMDGYAATRRMRAWEQAHGRDRTPIVAVTAHAFADDIEQSLAAGCDGHVTKPVRKNVLFEAVERYARGLWEPGGPDGRLKHSEPAAAAPLQALPIDSGPVRVTVPPEVAPYIPGYLDVTRQQLTAAVEALEIGDCLPLRTLGHNLKGSGTSFGLDEISRMGWRLERTAARGDVSLTREAARALGDYLERLEIT